MLGTAAAANPAPTAASALTAIAVPALEPALEPALIPVVAPVSASPPPSRELAGCDDRVVPGWEAPWGRAGAEGLRIEEG